MDVDLNRAKIVKEYFEIRILLSRNNKIKNEATVLVFELKNSKAEHIIIIKSSSASSGLRLATYDKKSEDWKIYESDSYDTFYKYMFKKIAQLETLDKNTINEELTNWLNRLWIIEFEKK